LTVNLLRAAVEVTQSSWHTRRRPQPGIYALCAGVTVPEGVL